MRQSPRTGLFAALWLCAACTGSVAPSDSELDQQASAVYGGYAGADGSYEDGKDHKHGYEPDKHHGYEPDNFCKMSRDCGPQQFYCGDGSTVWKKGHCKMGTCSYMVPKCAAGVKPCRADSYPKSDYPDKDKDYEPDGDYPDKDYEPEAADAKVYGGYYPQTCKMSRDCGPQPFYCGDGSTVWKKGHCKMGQCSYMVPKCRAGTKPCDGADKTDKPDYY